MFNTIEDRKKTIVNVLNHHNLTLDDISFFLSQNLTNSSKIINSYDESDFSYREIIGFFTPKNETIDITKITGLDFDGMTVHDTLLKIYRPESIFKNLGEFDINKFYNSLKSYDSNYELVEKNGNYYVNGDGNHRTLLMLFQYHLEHAKLIKEKAPKSEFDKLKKKFEVQVPVIHLQHDKTLISELQKMDRKYFEGLTNDFVRSILPKKHVYDCYLTKNKDNTYDVFCKGITKTNLTTQNTIDFLKKVNNINLNNNFFYKNNLFILYDKHIGVTNIPKERLSIMDDKISDLNLNDIGIDYFIKVDFKTKEISLDFATKDYGARYDVDHNLVNKFQKEHKDLFGDEEIIDYFGYLKEFHFDNISMKEALKIVNTMKQLNDIATKKSSR